MSPAPLVSFWEGPISWLEFLCARSALNAGHPLTIYSYSPEPLQSSGIEGDIRDAREVLPEQIIDNLRTVGRFNLLSDIFRLEIQRQGKGIWVDLDCYFLTEFNPVSHYVFGLLTPGKLANGVLKLPAGSLMVEEYMNAITAVPLRTPWATFRRRLIREVEILLGRPLPHPSKQTNIGPRALTYFAKKHDLMHHAMPTDVFYPISTNNALSLVAPDDRKVRASLNARTVLVHLWQTTLKKHGFLAELPPRTSYLGNACRQLGICA